MLSALGPICTARLGDHINGGNAKTLLCDAAAQIVGAKLGYSSLGLSTVVWLEIYDKTSGKLGHHEYRGRAGCGTAMKKLIRKHGLGYMSLSRYNGANTGTGSEARTVTWGVPGPLDELNRVFEKAFGTFYTVKVERWKARNPNRW